MTVLWIVFRALLCILLVLVLAVLLVPFTYRVRLARRQERSGLARLEGGWLFGLLRGVAFWEEQSGFGAKVVLAGIKVDVTSFADRSRRNRARRKTSKKEKEDKKKTSRRHRFSRAAMALIRASAERSVAHLKPRRLAGWGRIGLADPYHTGLLCAVLESTRGLGVHDLDIECVFDRERYEGEFEADGRLIIGYLVWQAIVLLLHKPSRELLLGA